MTHSVCELSLWFYAFPTAAALHHWNTVEVSSWPQREGNESLGLMISSHGVRNHRDTGKSPFWGMWEGPALGIAQSHRFGKATVKSLWLGFGRFLTVMGKTVIWKMMPRLIFLIVPGNCSFLVSLQGLAREVSLQENFSCQQWIAGNWDFCCWWNVDGTLIENFPC